MLLKIQCENCKFITLMEDSEISKSSCEKCNSKAINIVKESVTESFKSPKINLNER